MHRLVAGLGGEIEKGRFDGAYCDGDDAGIADVFAVVPRTRRKCAPVRGVSADDKRFEAAHHFTQHMHLSHVRANQNALAAQSRLRFENDDQCRR